jgi:DNA repair protein RecN (Recombination protein N)
MLKSLLIQNIILIDRARIAFAPGFNVLTGETGSGKSAVIQALSLATGKRADCTVIRRGADKGLIEASFEIEDKTAARAILDKLGVPTEDDSVVIRREISCQGRSRSFINDHQVHLSSVRDLAPYLLEMVAQHATQSLQSLDYHRGVVDIFGNLKPLVQRFAKSWNEECQLRKELQRLVESEGSRDAEVIRLTKEIDEIHEAALKEGEEEELFAEYSRLCNVEGANERLRDVSGTLSQEEGGVLNLLQRIRPQLEQLQEMDSSLADSIQCLHSAQLEIQEAAYTLDCYASRLECSPERLETVNDRLASYRSIKRRYGPELADVLQHLEDSERELDTLQGQDHRIADLEAELSKAAERSNTLALELSQKRAREAKLLEEHLTLHLRQLNMPQARLSIEIHPCERTAHGDDSIEFFLAPNLGETPVSARECASGGELSRIMLALTALLGEKEQIPTMVFDEVDANIGGETAALLGERLRELGQKHQILCITHFPQVARAAHQHLKISKEEYEGRTLTRVDALEGDQRQEEIGRMLGGNLALALT